MAFRIPSSVDKPDFSFLKERGINLYIKRDDLIHPIVSGNKWRKLKFNIELAKKEKFKTILTFGGAYSNHIHAIAFACKEAGLNSIGIIRGGGIKSQVQLSEAISDTLKDAIDFGMQLYFISREDYKKKDEKEFIDELKGKHGDIYIVPEGGANYAGILGCKEVLEEEKEKYDYICCAAGTGTTLTGLLLSLREGEKLLGFPALKGGEFLKSEIEKNSIEYFPEQKHRLNSLELICDYHFGGYAKVNDELKNFVADFFDQTNIQLDYIYNGKMMFGLFDLIKKGYFKNGTRILAIHTGGVQGNRGFQS